MLNRSFLRSRNWGRKLCTGAAALLLSQTSLAQYRFEFLDQLDRYSASVTGSVTNSEKILGIQMSYEDTFRVVTWQDGIVGNTYDTLTEQTLAFLPASSVSAPSTYLMLGVGSALPILAARHGRNREQRLARTA